MSGKSFPKFKSAPTKPKEDELVQHPIDMTTSVSTTESFAISRHGDFQIAKYDFKLGKSELPQYFCQAHPLGFPPSSRIVILPSGEFEIESSKSTDYRSVSRYYHNIDDNQHRFALPTNDTSDPEILAEFVRFVGEDETSEDAVIPTNRKTFNSLHRELQLNPLMVDKWIEFAQIAYKDASVSRIARQERAISILESALRHNPNSERLLLEYVELQEATQSNEVILDIWQLAIRKFRHSWPLRFRFIDFYSRHCFATYTVEQSIKYHLDLAEDLQTTANDGMDNSEEMSALISNLIHLLISSGHVYESIVLLYSIIMSRAKSDNPVEHSHFWSNKRNQFAACSLRTFGDKDLLLKELLSDFSDGESDFGIDDRLQKLNLKIYDLDHIKNLTLTFLNCIGVSFGATEKSSALQLPSLGLSFANSSDDPQPPTLHQWIVAGPPDFSVKPNLVVSEALSLPLELLAIILADLEPFSVLSDPCARIAQLRCFTLGIDDALQYLRAKLAVDPNDLNYWYHYVMMLRWMGDRDEEALRILSKLPILGTATDMVKYRLTCCICKVLAKQGKIQEALLTLFRSLSIDPPTISAASFLKAKTIISNFVDKELSKDTSELLQYLVNPKEHVQSTSPREFSTAPSSSTDLGGGLGEFLQVTAASCRDDARLHLMNLVRAAPYSKLLVLRACKYLQDHGWITPLEVKDLCLVIEEKGCRFNLI